LLGVTLETRPVFLLLLSQAGISVVMPLALLGLMWLSALGKVPGVHRPRPAEWVLLAAIAAFSLAMGLLALQGLLTDLRKLLL
jgi:manganese transport protein